MTIGKQLMGSSLAMLGLTVVLSVSSLSTTGSLGNELSKTASVTAREMELAGATAADAANMLSAERGMLLRLALGDQTTATTLNSSFTAYAHDLSREIEQMRALATDGERRTANERMSRALWRGCRHMNSSGSFAVSRITKQHLKFLTRRWRPKPAKCRPRPTRSFRLRIACSKWRSAARPSFPWKPAGSP